MTQKNHKQSKSTNFTQTNALTSLLLSENDSTLNTNDKYLISNKKATNYSDNKHNNNNNNNYNNNKHNNSTSYLSNILSSSSNPQQLYHLSQCPRRTQKYLSLYNKFLTQNNKLYKQLKLTQSYSPLQQKDQQLRSYISKSLHIDKQHQIFKEKFIDLNNTININNNNFNNNNSKNKIMNKILYSKYYDSIGLTQLQKNKQYKQVYFVNQKNVINFEQSSMLLQYFYKDKINQYTYNNNNNNNNNNNSHNNHNNKSSNNNNRKHSFNSNNTQQQQHVSIQYLKCRNKSQKKHKRIFLNRKQKQQIYLKHNYNHYNKLKNIHQSIHEKSKTQSYKNAQNNYQYKRWKNFQQMQKIIKDNHQNILNQPKNHKFNTINNNNINNNITSTQLQRHKTSSSAISTSMLYQKQQHSQRQLKYNKTIKIFLKFAKVQQTRRIFYDYIDQQGIQLLIKLMIQSNTKIKQQKLQQLINQITINKIQKILQIYDFIQLIQKVNKQYKIDILSTIKQKYAQIFICKQQSFITLHSASIHSLFKQCKTKFLLHIIFHSDKSKLIHSTYLPIKYIPRIFSNLGITGIDIPRKILFYIMYWNSYRKEGLNFDEFYNASVMLTVRNNNVEEGIKLYHKINVQKLIK